MKPAAHGTWRPLRWLLLVVCAGGILAADNSWISTFDFDFPRSGSWFASEPLNDSRAADLPLSTPQESIPRAQLSMGQLINGLLFSRPAHGWKLASLDDESSLTGLPREANTFAWAARNSDFMVETPRSTPISMKFVSDGFAKGSSSDRGILPTGPGGQIYNWIKFTSGNWTDASNWDALSVPNAPNVNVQFSNRDIGTAVTVSLGSNAITIGDLKIGDDDNTHSYTISASGGSLTFDNISQPSTLLQTSTSHGDTISAPIFLKNELTISNASSSNGLTLNGNIASTGGNQILRFDSHNVVVNGTISNGALGNFIFVEKTGSGLLSFNGPNSYTGHTLVSGGQFLINGDQSSATGSVQVWGAGTVLGGIGFIGGNVDVTSEGSITGGGNGDIGTLTLKQNLSLSGEVSAGRYLADIGSNGMSDLLAITGNLYLFGSSLQIAGTPDGSTYTIATFEGSLFGIFQSSNIADFPGYTLDYNEHDIQLVPTPIPEPATWLGGALALGAIGFASRRRLRPATRPSR